MAKKNMYLVELKPKRGLDGDTITVESKQMWVDARGALQFANGQSNFQPNIVMAFCPGSWVSARLVESDAVERHDVAFVADDKGGYLEFNGKVWRPE